MRRNPPKRPIDRASDPDTPIPELRQFSQTFPKQVMDNPVMPLLAMEDPAEWSAIRLLCQAQIAQYYISEFRRKTTGLGPDMLAQVLSEKLNLDVNDSRWIRSLIHQKYRESIGEGLSRDMAMGLAANASLHELATRRIKGGDIFDYTERREVEKGRLAIRVMGTEDVYMKNGRRRHGW